MGTGYLLSRRVHPDEGPLIVIQRCREHQHPYYRILDEPSPLPGLHLLAVFDESTGGLGSRHYGVEEAAVVNGLMDKPHLRRPPTGKPSGEATALTDYIPS